MTPLENALMTSIGVLVIGLVFTAHKWRDCLKWIPKRDKRGRWMK